MLGVLSLPTQLILLSKPGTLKNTSTAAINPPEGNHSRGDGQKVSCKRSCEHVLPATPIGLKSTNFPLNSLIQLSTLHSHYSRRLFGLHLCLHTFLAPHPRARGTDSGSCTKGKGKGKATQAAHTSSAVLRKG
eukprot:803044-Pelagomonas_calceolata.AAC.1